MKLVPGQMRPDADLDVYEWLMPRRTTGLPTLLRCEGDYTVEVEMSTHADLTAGRCATATHWVMVRASSALTAELTALEMVACHSMPTASRVIAAEF